VLESAATTVTPVGRGPVSVTVAGGKAVVVTPKVNGLVTRTVVDAGLVNVGEVGTFAV
jgi:hypothetical protein